MGKKKRSIGVRLIPLWIILGLLIVLALPPTILVVMAYDGRKNVTEYEPTSMEKVGSRSFLKGLNSISDDGLLQVGITRQDINGVMLDASKALTDKVEGLDNLYVLTEGENAIVYLEAHVQNFHTRISITTGLTVDDNYFMMDIKDFKLGSLALKKDLALKALDFFHIDLEKFSQDVQGFKIDLKNWRITIDKNQFVNALKTGSGQDDFVSKIFKLVEDNHLITFDTKSEHLIDMNIDLSKLKNNPYLTNDDDHLIINKPSSIYANIGVDEIKAEIGGKLDKIAPHISSDKLNTVFQFLFKGYDYCDDSTKNFMENFEANHTDILKGIGIYDVTKYTSYMKEIDENSGSLLGNAKAQVSYAAMGSSKVCQLFEKDINNYIRNLGILGHGDVVSFGTGENTNYGFFVVDNFYCNIIDNELYFVVGLNINGYETNVVLHLEQADVPSQPSKTFFKIDTINFGEVDASSLLNTVLDILKGGSGTDGIVGFTKIENDSYFYFDLSSIVDKVKEFDPTMTADRIKLVAHGENIQDEGYFSIEID